MILQVKILFLPGLFVMVQIFFMVLCPQNSLSVCKRQKVLFIAKFLDILYDEEPKACRMIEMLFKAQEILLKVVSKV